MTERVGTAEWHAAAARLTRYEALRQLRRYPIKHPRHLLGVAIEGRVIRDFHLAAARAALRARVVAEWAGGAL